MSSTRSTNTGRTFLPATAGALLFAAAFACSASPTVPEGPVDVPTTGIEDAGTFADCFCGTTTAPPEVGPGAATEGEACVTSVDCIGGLVCGYGSADGCAAQGACVAQVSGPAGPPACGCDGNPVQYVAPGYTGVPVASPASCGADAAAEPDANADDASSGDAGDAG